jgi:hypothetical protein
MTTPVTRTRYKSCMKHASRGERKAAALGRCTRLNLAGDILNTGRDFQVKAPSAGLEPATPYSASKCSNPLSYEGKYSYVEPVMWRGGRDSNPR